LSRADFFSGLVNLQVLTNGLIPGNIRLHGVLAMITPQQTGLLVKRQRLAALP